MRYLSILFIVFVFLCLSSVSIAKEQPGISVTPSLLQIDLKKDPPQAVLYYKNTTSSTVELAFSAQDFTELGETGQMQFLNDTETQTYKYSLSSWVTFDQNTLTLAPGETGQVTVFIDKDQLPAGGHYASIFAEIREHQTNGHIQVKGIVSSILFVRAASGHEREEGTISSFEPDSEWLLFPETMILRFKNTGNVETIPYGLIEIKDEFGHTVSKSIINEGSLITLPESIRRYDVLVYNTSYILPGIYTAYASVHYGKNHPILSAQTTFISQGSVNLLKYGAILLVIIVGLVLFRRYRNSAT